MPQAYWISDPGNHALRYVNSSGVITTPTLTSSDPTYIANGGFTSVLAVSTDNKGNLFVVDNSALGSSGSAVYRVDSHLNVTSVAGALGGSGARGCALTFANGCCCDGDGNLLIGGSTSPGFSGWVVAVNTQATAQTIYGVSIPAGGIAYIVGSATSGSGYSGDGGPGTSAKTSFPYGLAVDRSGNLLICDGGVFHGSTGVRKLTPSGIISSVAGGPTAGMGFAGDGGSATSAKLNNSHNVAIDQAGNFYISDSLNFCVRAVNTQGTTQTLFGVSISPGCIQTITGIPTVSGYSGDGGSATGAHLAQLPAGLAIDANGTLLIADSQNGRVRAVTPSGVITTIAGNGTNGYSGDGGSATSAEISSDIFSLVPQTSVSPTSFALATTPQGQPFVNHVWQVGEDVVSRTSQTLTVTASGAWTLTTDNPYVTFDGLPSLSGTGNSTVTVAIADDGDFPPGYAGRVKPGIYTCNISVVGSPITVPVEVRIGYGDNLN